MDSLCREKNMSRDEVISWAKDYARLLTQKEKNDNCDTVIPFSPDKIIELDLQRKFNCGYLFLQNKNRIEAHFLICFISLIIYRLLAEKLDNKYTVAEILTTLRGMELVDTNYNGYIPVYHL